MDWQTSCAMGKFEPSNCSVRWLTHGVSKAGKAAAGTLMANSNSHALLSLRPLERGTASACCQTARPWVALSICPSIRPSVRLSVRQSIQPFIHPSIHPSVLPSFLPSLLSSFLPSFLSSFLLWFFRPFVHAMRQVFYETTMSAGIDDKKLMRRDMGYKQEVCKRSHWTERTPQSHYAEPLNTMVSGLQATLQGMLSFSRTPRYVPLKPYTHGGFSRAFLKALPSGVCSYHGCQVSGVPQFSRHSAGELFK